MTYNSTSDTKEHGPCPYIGHYSTIKDNFICVGHAFYIQLQVMYPILMRSCVGHRIEKGCCVASVKMAMALHYTCTLWNAVGAAWGHGYGWVLYYFLELFPITVMYFLVVIFHIRATSSQLNAIVFMSQIVVYIIRLNVPFHMYIQNDFHHFV